MGTHMDRGVKIATIGGGSSYTPELVEGLIQRYETLPVRQLWLVDIPEGEEKLQVVSALAERMVKKAGVPMEIHATLDRRKALEGADFATTQLRVGQLKARIKDERIPLSHGLMGQETNGAGGLLNGLRTIPVILDICRDMENLCPEAWLINFTNPVGMVMEGVERYSSWKRVIGLCNVPFGMHKEAAQLLRLPMDQVSMTFGGLNHMVFGTKVEVAGQDVTSQVVALWGKESVKNIKAVVWDPDFIRELGVLPCSYHRYYYMAKEYLEEAMEKYKSHETRAEMVCQVENQLFSLYRDPGLSQKPKLLEQRGGAYYSNAACSLIHSIYNDSRDVQVVDTVNHGAVEDFEDGEVVEASCVITKEGPKPVHVGRLPKPVRGLVQQIKSFEVAGCQAAATGDYGKALLAMAIHPMVASLETGRAVLDELLEAHKDYLPQFFGKSEGRP